MTQYNTLNMKFSNSDKIQQLITKLSKTNLNLVEAKNQIRLRLYHQ